MALIKGARRCYEWLKKHKSGDTAPVQELLDATGWSKVSLKTYLNKNKLAPFLVLLQNDIVKVLLGGADLAENHFDEVFTQTAPSKIALSPGDILAGRVSTYVLVEPLGNGAIGHVWSARNSSDGTLVAAKVMLPREDLLADSKIHDVRRRFRRESENGAKLAHPRIVRHLDSGEIQGNPFLVMELGQRSVGRRLREETTIGLSESAQIMLDVLDALEHLHGSKCPHRDVKPDNIIQFAEVHKLGDLGIVKWTDFDRSLTTGGTITRSSMQLGSWFYMAPEQQQDPHEATTASDVYALGITWIQILSGNVPAPHAVAAGQYPKPCDDARVCEIIQRMVSYLPSDRPSLSEIRSLVSEVGRVVPPARPDAQ